jgi:hypothetical protein
MPRRKSAPAEPGPPRAGAGPLGVIDPHAVYDVAGARAALKLHRTTIRREVREGRLRVSCRAGKYYILGQWLLDWLTAGPAPRRRPHLSGQAGASRPEGAPAQ